jgi:hypothetical protein
MMVLLVALAGAWCVVVLVLLSVCRFASRADRFASHADRLPAAPIGCSKGAVCDSVATGQRPGATVRRRARRAAALWRSS